MSEKDLEFSELIEDSKHFSELTHAHDFLNYSIERYKIFLRRKEGMNSPWTRDLVLREFSFCNIFREDDRTTIWFRDNIRDPLNRDTRVFIATVAFRWFNRITTGEIIKDILLEYGWNRAAVERRLEGVAPVVTGAYIIKTPNGRTKLQGVCDCIDGVQDGTADIITRCRSGAVTLEGLWERLCEFPYLGPFMAYEIVTDLAHTWMGWDATDHFTWASPGPGAARGISRVVCGETDTFSYNSKADRKKIIYLMRRLLSFMTQQWPKQYPCWGMREVEHTLCEFDKYKRGQEGGKMKRKYKEMRT